MIPWIQVYSNLIRHPKVSNLADRLGLSSNAASPNAVAAGMLVSLWLWAAQNASNGDLSQCSDRAIAEAAEYRKKPGTFVEALVECKFLDQDRRLHDWDEYATLLMDCEDQQRKKTRERVARHRAKKKAQCNEGCNVTGTSSNGSTIPYNTIPNHNALSDMDKGQLEGEFGQFWEAYPAKGCYRQADAWEVWVDLFTKDPAPDVAEILAGLDAWKRSGRWEPEFPRYVPNPARFLAESWWKQAPKNREFRLGEAEQEAISRMLEAE